VRRANAAALGAGGGAEMGLRLRQDGRQGILPFVIEQAERDDVTARAGLPLVV
jgi:hypothetical protein